MNGQLRAESEEGRGSKFTFAFNFPIPTAAQETAFLESAATSSGVPENTPVSYSVPLSPERPAQVRRQSNDSIRSRGSTNSGRSEIDQLVEMIASPSLEEASRSNNRNLKRRSSPTAERGNFSVQDSGVAIRSVKVDESEVDVPAARQPAPTSVTASAARNLLKPAVSFKPKSLNVLVAEDDPVNRAILKKRLEMDGHQVILTHDGSEVVEKFAKFWQNCDIILMDLQVCPFSFFCSYQMPILDGVSATKRIREDERQRSPVLTTPPRTHARNHNRVPIFAVSASLPESRADEITRAQFDGWILKPINFRRVNELIGGVWDYDQRKRELYAPDGTKKHWERGGWLIPPPE